MTTFDTKGVDPFLRVVREGVTVGLLQAGQALAATMQRTLSGPSPSSPGAPPGVSDGTLRRSIQVVQPSPSLVRVGSNVFYGAVQETGNWGRPIFPVRAKFLLVPLNREARRLYRKANFNIRSVGLHLIPRPGKPSLLVRERGRTGGRGWRFEPLFVLKRSVKLPPRPWAVPSFKAIGPELPAIFSRAAAKHIRTRLVAA